MRNETTFYGFSLLEMLLCLTIFFILFRIGIVAWYSFTEKTALDLLTQRIFNALPFARQIALRSREETFFCGSSDHVHCDGHWNAGQLIMTKFSQHIYFNWNVPLNIINFFWQGALHTHDLVITQEGLLETNGSFYFYNKQHRLQRKIVVTQTGRMRVYP